MIIEIQLQPILCSSCDGNGWYEWSTMGPTDNMDIDHGIQDPCDSCGGYGYDDVEDVEVVVA